MKNKKYNFVCDYINKGIYDNILKWKIDINLDDYLIWINKIKFLI